MTSTCRHIFRATLLLLWVLYADTLQGQTYAKGFQWGKTAEGYRTIAVRTSAKPEQWSTYVLVAKSQTKALKHAKSIYKQVIPVPVTSVILTSTTQIPGVEALGELHQVRGFTGLPYISSQAARKAIDQGRIAGWQMGLHAKHRDRACAGAQVLHRQKCLLGKRVAP